MPANITVKVPAIFTIYNVDTATYRLIHRGKLDRVDAIKFLREVTGIGLKEAADLHAAIVAGPAYHLTGSLVSPLERTAANQAPSQEPGHAPNLTSSEKMAVRDFLMLTNEGRQALLQQWYHDSHISGSLVAVCQYLATA